jgi:uncharacterized protein (TIGR02271 family)
MSTTVVGCFDDRSDAAAVERELIEAGIDRSDVRMTAESGGSTGTSSTQPNEPGVWESIKEAFGFADDRDRHTYAEAARRGGIIVSVESADAATDRVVEIMRRHNAVDLDNRASTWRNEGWTGYAAGARTTGRADESIAQMNTTPQQQAQPMAQTSEYSQGGEVIPVIEEELRVGKRAVQQGGVRVYSRVTERPVEEQVNLREERVSVERRPVDRPIGDADRAFQERSIEATETAEEAVVAKQARVVEEIVVNKDVGQRTETVRDTVRRTDVNVESMPGQRAGDATTTSAGMSYDDFTTELASDNRYQGRDWDTMEPDVRTSFQQRYPQGRWDDSRDAIREGYERMRLRTRSNP